MLESVPLAVGIARFASAPVLACSIAFGSGLADLARLDGAPGDEGRVIEYIRNRVGGSQRTGGNGSLIALFGNGSPRTLLVAGVDEPGYAVSEVRDDGYLRVRALAESPLATGLGDYFLGQHVRVSTQAAGILQGVVAAPSVHFASGNRVRNRSAPAVLFVDIGARNRLEAAAAGVAVLDRVTLHKEPAPLVDGWLSAPWISSRSGAAILLSLARRLNREAFPGSVTLAFVTQQYPHNSGLSRVLPSVDADQVMLLAPNGGSTSAIAAVSGGDSDLAEEVSELAERTAVRLDRKPSQTLSFGPFGAGRPWRAGQRIAVLAPAARNRGTPAEAVRPEELERLSYLLALLVGLDGPDPEPMAPSAVPHRPIAPELAAPERESELERDLRLLVETPGVSGDESRVRRLLSKLLPASNSSSYSTRVDEKGNLIARLGNGAQPSAAFIAHMDEIGFAVRHIASGGSVSVDSRGGGTPSLFAWQPVAVHGSYGTLAAVMTRAGNLDFGATTSDQIRAEGVRATDSATVPKRYRKLLGSRVSARSLDDRLGCAVLVDAVRRLARRTRRAPGAVEFVFTVEEETGLKGARHFAEKAAPAHVYPIDTFVTSDSPLESPGFAHAALGEGPVLRALDESGMTPRSALARINALARRNGIPLQSGVTAGGNDGSVFRSLKTVNIPLGFPLRYAHTPVETADLRDAEAAVELIELLAREQLQKR